MRTDISKRLDNGHYCSHPSRSPNIKNRNHEFHLLFTERWHYVVPSGEESCETQAAHVSYSYTFLHVYIWHISLSLTPLTFIVCILLCYV
jgi:hypothetical protein